MGIHKILLSTNLYCKVKLKEVLSQEKLDLRLKMFKRELFTCAIENFVAEFRKSVNSIAHFNY